MTYILHIDTSADTGIVALSNDGELLAVKENRETRNHAATINIHIDELLKEQGVRLKDISAFCVCGGPGSYTGLRIGLATAKGFCYALDKPLMMHNRLLLLSLPQIYAGRADNYVSVLQAREGEYFMAAWSIGMKEVKAPQHVFKEHVSEFMKGIEGGIHISGQVDDVIRNVVATWDAQYSDTTVIDTSSWARYAHEEFVRNSFVTLVSSEPFYLKQVYTHKPKNTK